MTISSRQRRLFKEQDQQKAENISPEATPQQQAVEPQGQPTNQAGGKQDSQAVSTVPIPEQEKVQKTIKAIEKLQSAAVSIEAGRFVMQHEYSDFSLAKKLDILKQQLVEIIGKAKEHIIHSSAQSPEAEKLVSQWLKL
jgi:hypothetical protein